MATVGNTSFNRPRYRGSRGISAPIAAPRANTRRRKARSHTARLPDRVVGVGVLMGALYLGLAGRLFFLQVMRHDAFVHQAESMRDRSVSLPARRGMLLDRNGTLLVRNEPALDVVLDPNVWYVNTKPLDTPESRQQRVIHALSPLLPHTDVAAIIAQKGLLKGKTGRYRPFAVATKVPAEIRERIETEKLSGVGLVPTSRRVAIDGTLAPHVIGFTGRDGLGLDGLENGLDGPLTGESGMIAAEFDHKGRPIPGTIRTERPAQNGRDVVLTLDASLQHTVQEALRKAYEKHHAEAASAVVLNPATGDILACANFPTYDVNKRGAVSVADRVNRAVTSPFEPGSTLKIVTVAAALEEKKVTPDSRFSCNGSRAIGKRTIHCHLDNAFPHGHGDENLNDVIKNSCNVATAQCAFLVGKQKLYDYETAFGLGAKTGAGLPGESRGLLKSPARWSDIQLANIAFGQGISVTPLQLAATYAAIANDGVYMRPRIVWGNRDEATQKLVPNKIDEGRRVVSPQTAQELRQMLQIVVDSGTGRNAQLDGYTAGGKTGTAQIAEGGHYGGKFVASFVGMAPMTRPRFVILVSVTAPQNGHFGAEVSAPVFKEIAEQALLADRVARDKAPTPAKAAARIRVPLRDD